MSVWRIVRLAAANVFRSPLRLALLVTLVAGSMTIFLVINALSAASRDTLNEAVEAESGAAGTYRVTISRALGLTRPEVSGTAEKALGDLARRPLVFGTVLPATRPDCPPFDTLGTPQLVVRRSAEGSAIPAEWGSGLPAGARLCLGGLEVPATSMALPSSSERRMWGSNVLFLAPEYEELVRLTSTEPVSDDVLVVTGDTSDRTEELHQRFLDVLAPVVAHQAVDGREIVTVNRVDADPQTRAASEGVALMYGVIAWGVLGLGALAVLVAQLILLRERTWLLGLARAMGAAPVDIAVLLLMEVVVTVALGVALACALALVGQPAADGFAMSAFQTHVRLLSADLLPALTLGTLVLAAVGGLYPGWRAMRLDPLEVLDRR